MGFKHWILVVYCDYDVSPTVSLNIAFGKTLMTPMVKVYVTTAHRRF